MKKCTLLLSSILCLCAVTIGQNFSLGLGFNKQYHRIQYLKDELPNQDVSTQFIVTPTLYLACKLNKKISLVFDISYLQYHRTIKTNINFNHPENTKDDKITTNYEKTPILFSKINYNIYSTKNDIKFFVSTGCSFSHQSKDDEYLGFVTSSDSLVSGTDNNFRPSYTLINYLIGFQINLPLTDNLNINFSLNNVFGGKKYLFKQEYDVSDAANTHKKLEYGLFGGFAYFDFKFVYNFGSPKKDVKKDVEPLSTP